ncbi:MAG: hypothetical protein KBG15_20200 [Kofleriaceae bacterium]|nr:hypothetical protein [Kofleriaceae bacterium]
MTQQRQAPDSNAELQLEAELRRLRRDDQRHQPDWSAMQASITLAVAKLPAPQLPWWRRWSVMVPATGALLAGAAALVLWRVQASEPPTLANPPVLAALSGLDAAAAIPATPATSATEAGANAASVLLVLDGEDLDVASIDETALQQVFVDETQAMADAVASDDSSDSVGGGAESGNLVPSSLQWVDTLAADDLDQLDRWLDSQIVKKG